MYRADASVVGSVNIANFKTSTLTSKPAGAERGEYAQVFHFGQDIFLAHELRKLVCCEKLFNTCLEWALIYNLNGQRCRSINCRHAVLDIAFYLHHTSPDFLL